MFLVEQVTSSGSPGDARDDGKGSAGRGAGKTGGAVQQKPGDLKRKSDVKTPDKQGVSPAKKPAVTPTGKTKFYCTPIIFTSKKKTFFPLWKYDICEILDDLKIF